MSVKLNAEIEECVRNNVTWSMLPDHLQQVIIDKTRTHIIFHGLSNYHYFHF